MLLQMRFQSRPETRREKKTRTRAAIPVCHQNRLPQTSCWRGWEVVLNIQLNLRHLLTSYLMSFVLT